jgi:RNA polymerase sigma-70 factor (ECF subfamily)
MQTEALTRPHIKVRAKQALVATYEYYSPRLYRYAYRLLGDQDLAEECVSETFSRFLKTVLQGGNQPVNTQAYLYRTAHNWIIDQYRARETEVLDPEQYYDSLGNPLLEVSNKLEQERVRSALLRLPAEQRQVIVLRFLEDWRHEQVAEAIGKSIDATRAIQHRAIATLRKLLIGQEE